LAGWIAEPVLDHLGVADLFPVVVHAGSGAGRKPSGQPIRAALDALGVNAASPAHVYIGDAVDDYRAATSAGIGFAWASWGYGAAPDGVRVMRHPSEILTL
jgi:phosphoglycolate phosphatase